MVCRCHPVNDAAGTVSLPTPSYCSFRLDGVRSVCFFCARGRQEKGRKRGEKEAEFDFLSTCY
jgi:hypothetical protein